MSRGNRQALAAAVVGLVALLAWLLVTGTAEPDRATVLGGERAGREGLREPASLPAAPVETPSLQSAVPLREEVTTTPASEPAAAAPAVVLRGRVLDVAGHPVPQAGVLLTLDRSDAWDKHWAFIREGPDAVPTHVVSGADGRFELHADAPAASAQPRLVVHHEGFATLEQPCLGLRAGETDVGDIVLEPGAAVRGRTLDAQRQPLKDVDITFSDLAGGAEPRDGDEIRLWFVARRSGTDGGFVAAGLRALPMELTAERRGLRPVVLRELPLAAGATLDVGDLVIEEGGVIAGTVLDDTDAAMGNVTVAATKRGDWHTFDEADGAWRGSARSDATGAFRIAGLQPGRYDVSSLAAAQAAGAGRADDVGIGTADLRLVMPRYGSALVRLTDPDGGPIAGATLQATIPMELRHGAWSEWQFLVSQGADAGLEPGFYRVTGVGVEGAEITVRAQGFVPGKLRAPPVAPTVEALLDLVLQRAAHLAGRVLDDVGSPIAGGSVSASRAGVPVPTSAASDAHGDFVLDGIDLGTWKLSAAAADHASATLSVDVPEGGLRDPLQLVLSRCGAVEGVALRGDAPLAAARVRAVLLPADVTDPDSLREALHTRSDDAPHRLRAVDTDAQGRFRFDGLPPGRCIVWLSRGEPDERWAAAWAAAGPAELPAAAWADVRPGETAIANLVQPGGATLRVRVSADGVARQGAPVALSPAELKLGSWPFAAATGITDDLGALEFADVPPGHWLVVTQVPGGLVPLVADLEVLPGELRHVDLVAEGRPMQIVVVDAVSGAALADARLSFGVDLEPETGLAAQLWGHNMLGAAESLCEGIERAFVTDAAGTLTLHWLPQGNYSLTAEAKGYLPGSAQAAIAPSLVPEPLRLELVRGAVLSGEVRGEGLTQRQLEAGIGWPGEPPRAWSSVRDGRFRFDALEPGEYVVRIFAQPDLQQAIGLQRVVLAAGQSQDIVILLDG